MTDRMDGAFSAGKPAVLPGVGGGTRGCPKGSPPASWHLPGRRTHQSSSTTRTSTKNVFLLTRFLNVSAKGENFSYVECGLKKGVLTQAGVVWWGRGLPAPSCPLGSACGAQEPRG